MTSQRVIYTIATNLGNLKFLAILPQIGLSLSLPLVGGVMLGFFVDRQMGWHSGATISGCLLGLIAGVYGAGRFVLKFLGEVKRS